MTMDNTLEPKYSSNYPSEVTYRSDKNFIVRLKAMIDRNMKAAGYPTSHSNEQFMKFIESMGNAEDYLFDQKAPQAATMDNTLSAEEILRKHGRVPNDESRFNFRNHRLITTKQALSAMEEYRSQPAPQGEGLYRWIKATKDNIPEKKEPLVVRYVEPGHKARCKFMHTNALVWHLETRPFDVYEYLEPLPSQPQGDVSILLEALRKVMAEKRLPGEKDDRYVYNRCWNHAEKALSPYQSSIKPISNP